VLRPGTFAGLSALNSTRYANPYRRLTGSSATSEAVIHYKAISCWTPDKYGVAGA
jgi:hypothetical protein